MSDKELNLDGGEISVLKAIGLSGSEVTGEDLLKRVPDQEAAELLDTLRGLISLGYVECDSDSLNDSDAFKHYHFHVNSGYAKDLRDAMNPQRVAPTKSKRVRRE